MPPEAYTNHELAEAMTWRESQPEYIKDITNSPESLMSFYKRLMRSKPGGKATKPKTGGDSSDYSTLTALSKNMKVVETDEAQKEAAPEPQPETPAEPVISPPTAADILPQAAPDVAELLDGKSLSMIREVKAAFNLSSDCEALRLLISLGFGQIRQSLPRPYNI